LNAQINLIRARSYYIIISITSNLRTVKSNILKQLLASNILIISMKSNVFNILMISHILKICLKLDILFLRHFDRMIR